MRNILRMPRIAVEIPEETREKIEELTKKNFTISDIARFALDDFLPAFERGEVQIVNNAPVRVKPAKRAA